MSRQQHDWEPGDMVEWQDDGNTYVGRVTAVLNTMLVVLCRSSPIERFVFLSNRTLRRYVDGE